MFSEVHILAIPTPTLTGFLYPEIQNGGRKQEVVSVVPSLLMSERLNVDSYAFVVSEMNRSV